MFLSKRSIFIVAGLLALLVAGVALGQMVESGGYLYWPKIRITGGSASEPAIITVSSTAPVQFGGPGAFGGTVEAPDYATVGGSGVCAYKAEQGAYFCGDGASASTIFYDGTIWNSSKGIALTPTTAELCFGSTSAQCMLYGGAGVIQTKSGTGFAVVGATLQAQASTDLRDSTFNGGSGANCIGRGTSVCLNDAAGATVADGSNNSLINFGAKGINWLGATPRKRLGWQTSTNADTDFNTEGVTTIGVAAPSDVNGGGTCTPAADTADDAYAMIKFPTDAGGAGHACGRNSAFTILRATFLPSFSAVVRTDASAVTSQTVFIGMVASSLDQITTLAGANGIRGCWFRYDTGLSDTAWQACSSDGTTASCSTTSVTVAAATTYAMGIDNTVSGTCDYYINGVRRVNKTSNISVANTALGIEATITARASAARSLSVSKVIVEQN